MAHTAGNWTPLKEDFGAWEVHVSPATDDAAPIRVARIFGDEKEAADNAQLIAASKELLAACKAQHSVVGQFECQ